MQFVRMQHQQLRSDDSIVQLDRVGKSRNYRRLILLALVGAAANLLIIALFATFFANSLAELHSQQKRATFVSHLTIDNRRLLTCPTAPLISQLPCRRRGGGYLTSEAKPLGPWICPDAAPGSCPAGQGSHEIAIPQNGVFMILVQTVFIDRLASEVTLQLRVNDQVRRACALNSTVGWSACSVSMLEGLRSGDRVTVIIPQAFRLINSFRSLTYVDLTRIGGSGEV